MLSVRRRAAIAAGKNFAVGHQALYKALRRIGNRAASRIQRLQLEMGAFGKVVADSAD